MVKASDVFRAVSKLLQDFVRVLAAFGRWRTHPGLGALHVYAWTQQALTSQDRMLDFGDDGQCLDLFVGKALLDVEYRPGRHPNLRSRAGSAGVSPRSRSPR